MERKAFRWDDWCPVHGGYGGFNRKCNSKCTFILRNDVEARKRYIVEMRLGLAERNWSYRRYALNASFPDVCINCGDHDSGHVNGRCLVGPTRFQ